MIKKILFMTGITDPRTIDQMPLDDIVKRYFYRFMSLVIVGASPFLAIPIFYFIKSLM